MRCNQTYVPDEAHEVNEPTEQLCYNNVIPQSCLAFPDCPTSCNTLLQRESVEEFQQETKQAKDSQYAKCHRSSGISLTNRRERNRERERVRQTCMKGGFNLLRSVIPDYFSERKPGDRLTRIQTLRLAMKYIATLHDLLETS